MKDYTKISKLISLILRHKPEFIKKSIDSNGYMSVLDLLEGLNNIGNNITFGELKYIVETDNKQRYSFNDDMTKIRANQGHSIKVDVGLNECQPPDVLFHGTGDKYIGSIKKNGILKKTRQYVHLSSSLNIAIEVGKRHGKEVVLKVYAKKMYDDGYKFYLSKNGVWLTDYVPVKYFEEI